MEHTITLTEKECRIIADALLEHQSKLGDMRRTLESYGINELSIEIRMSAITRLLGKL